MKKRFILVSAAFCFITISHAQIRKGSVLLGGSIGFNKQDNQAESTNSKINMFSVRPSVGVAFKDNWVVGVTTGLSQSKVKPISISQKDELNAFSAGVFVRRYAALGKNFYLYGNATASYNQLKREEIIGTDYIKKSTSKGFAFGITPGVTYAVSKRFHLEASLNDLFTTNYSKTKKETITLTGYTKEEQKNLGIQTNLNTTAPLSMGFRFLLGK